MFGSSKKRPPRLQMMTTNLTSNLGSASYNPSTGAVMANLSPELQSLRDLFYSGVDSFAPTDVQTQFADNVGNYGMGLFNRAANLDTQAMANDYYNQQQANLAPSRAMEEARLGDTLFKSGRTGYGTGYMDGGYVNPEQFSLLKAREEANANMMLNSEDRARNIQNQELAQALGLVNSGNALGLLPYSNMATVAGYGTEIDKLGLGLFNPLQSFSNTQQQWQGALQQNAAARQKSSGGFMSGLGGGILSGASNVLGSGLGNWASGALFGSTPVGAATSALAPTSTNYLGTDFNLGSIGYF